MTETGVYRVLARKYRPTTFAALIGQEAMVRTLENAFASGRLAHAFILTGVRGVGKTTTARLLARALNCTKSDRPTFEPCGECDNCRRIAEDRHVDVLEMDAASRTGIGDIREIIEQVRYAPVAARYKVYIIDEVHMLSTAAFNGLLKTLEEPPPHVKFIFATTEIRKVPVTVLSRCQRFDLRRVDSEVLLADLARIAELEGVPAERAALGLIVGAAEGSVRDAQSLLDQAIAHGNGKVTAEAVRDMLGLADRGRIFDLFEALMQGDIQAALDLFHDQYQAGADPQVVMRDLLEVCHWVSRIKVTPQVAEDATVADFARDRGRALAAALSVPVLQRFWQMLLKGQDELRQAGSDVAAAEMVLMRLCFAADLPAPADLVQALTAAGMASVISPAASAPTPGSNAGPAPAPAPTSALGDGGARALQQAGGRPAPLRQSAPVAAAEPGLEPRAAADPADLAALLALADEKRDLLLKGYLYNYVHLVRFEPGRIEFRLPAEAPADVAGVLSDRLQRWTGRRWGVVVSAEAGQPTLAETARAEAASREAEVMTEPLVQAALAAFPGAAIRAVRAAADEFNPEHDPEHDSEAPEDGAREEGADG